MDELVQRYQKRPSEALYHTASDPFELVNLAESESSASIRNEFSAELDRWMASQGDPGAQQDTPAPHQAAKKGNHRFRPPTLKSSNEQQSRD